MATLEGADKAFADAVNRLMKEQGANLQSGYRSSAQQSILYEKAKAEHGEANARNWAAPPGHSNHEKGFAADIGNYQNISNETLAKYGLYRPMSWEPWHVEPIGYRSGSKQAYTKPRVADDKVTATIDNFGSALNQLFQPGQVMMGEQSSTVDANVLSTVGENAMATADVLGGQASAAPSPTGEPTPGEVTLSMADTDGMEIDRFMNAIAGKETGGKKDPYSTPNSTGSGAYGKYQIMPANWPSWSKEAGLPANAPQTPENQEKVARFKMQSYYNKFGNWHDVAVAWYAGPGAVAYKNKNAGQGDYPTINQYASDVMKRMN